MLTWRFFILQNWSKGTFQTTRADSVHPLVHFNFSCPCHQAPVSSAGPGATVAFAAGDHSLWIESSVWEEWAQDSVFNKCSALLSCCSEQKPEENTTSMFLLQQISLPGKTFLHFFCMCVLMVAISTLSIPKIISCGKDLISFNSNNNFSNSCHFLPMFLHFGIEPNYMF